MEFHETWRNQDYTINLQHGRNYFTSFRPIFKQNFITISYNYTNRNYKLFHRHFFCETSNRKTENFLRCFLENDNKNAPLSFEFIKEDEQILANAGNNQDLMFAPSAVITEYDVNKICTNWCKIHKGNYYEFSTDKSGNFVQRFFHLFWSWKRRLQTETIYQQRKSFEFVGAGNGDYSALRKLPSPQKSQVFSTSAEYTFNKGKIGGDFL